MSALISGLRFNLIYYFSFQIYFHLDSTLYDISNSKTFTHLHFFGKKIIKQHLLSLPSSFLQIETLPETNLKFWHFLGLKSKNPGPKLWEVESWLSSKFFCVCDPEKCIYSICSIVFCCCCCSFLLLFSQKPG